MTTKNFKLSIKVDIYGVIEIVLIIFLYLSIQLITYLKRYNLHELLD